jgi:septal ring factor EnvC (AmiA/AmiB activator)
MEAVKQVRELQCILRVLSSPVIQLLCSCVPQKLTQLRHEAETATERAESCEKNYKRLESEFTSFQQHSANLGSKVDALEDKLEATSAQLRETQQRCAHTRSLSQDHALIWIAL